MLGGTQPVWASAAIGLDDAGQPDLERLEAAIAEGYRRAKLKITADVDPRVLARACELMPAGDLGLDANGSLADAGRALMTRIDKSGFAYLEQPGSIADLDWHAELRQALSTPLALDESAHSLAAIDAILAAGAADIINLKVGRFGTRETLEIAKRVVTTGIAVRLGGLIESGIGRAHTVAVATCADFTGLNDIAGSDRYLTDDLVIPSWRLDSGLLPRPEQPGIGVAVDEEAVEHFATARFDGE
jgi:O-succinylbenzoate synthase